jgi:hypothetical protein
VEPGVLRELFRNLKAWRALYETIGLEEIVGPDGKVYNLWDIEYLYEQVPKLPLRMRQAIQLCLIDNIRERDAAQAIGTAPTNTVGTYATPGLRKLCAMIESGELPRFREGARLQQAVAG